MKRYDFLVIGSGKGGKTLAMKLAGDGASVGLIERKWIGGSCINLACIPTTTLVKTAKVAHLFRNARSYGVAFEGRDGANEGAIEGALPGAGKVAGAGKVEGVQGENGLDMRAVLERKRSVVEQMVERNKSGFARSGVDLLIGQGRFVGEEQVLVDFGVGGAGDGRVGEEVFSADRIVINTGASPVIPEVPGLGRSGALTNETLLELDRLPEHLIVLGGGYIGVEFAQVFRRLGSRVTLIDRNERFLPKEDLDISDSLLEVFHDEGIEVNLGATVERVEGRSGEEVRVELATAKGQRLVAGSDLLVALGRRPNTQELDCQVAKVKIGQRGEIEVDERLQTSNSRVWGVGDVTGGLQFTHVSWDDYRVLYSNLKGGNRTTKGRLVPYTLFTDPELGRVGLTEDQARGMGKQVRIAKMPANAIPRAMTSGETRGLLKAVIDQQTDEILGVSILCAEAGEILATIQVAMLSGMKAGVLRDVIFSHPTMAEAINDWLYR
jgi:pyruvate/2-oxoglutarate dehydrogenase complex dihydrolipoamide dehydrogenase (E3) component